MRVRSAWCAAILFSLAASAALAKESVSAEEWAFRYQHLTGRIRATGSLVDLFEPENPYCPFPMRPAKQDDQTLLDTWSSRLQQLSNETFELGARWPTPTRGCATRRRSASSRA